MAAQVKHANANSAVLAHEVEGLKQQLASAQAACRLSPASVLEQPLEDALLSSSSGTFGSISNDIFADANRCGAFRSETDQAFLGGCPSVMKQCNSGSIGHSVFANAERCVGLTCPLLPHCICLLQGRTAAHMPTCMQLYSCVYAWIGQQEDSYYKH